MNTSTQKLEFNPLLKLVKLFFTKLVKAQDEYPVRYYKKNKKTTNNHISTA